MMQGKLYRQSKLSVPGLRNYAANSDINVFRANDDGSNGQFLRTEPDVWQQHKFIHPYPKENGQMGTYDRENDNK